MRSVSQCRIFIFRRFLCTSGQIFFDTLTDFNISYNSPDLWTKALILQTHRYNSCQQQCNIACYCMSIHSHWTHWPHTNTCKLNDLLISIHIFIYTWSLLLWGPVSIHSLRNHTQSSQQLSVTALWCLSN